MGQISKNEVLVDLRKAVPGIVIALDKERMKIEKTAYARTMVARKLAAAQEMLPRGFHFIVRDAWRPAFVQVDIYFSFIKMFAKKYPRWSKMRLVQETKRYVAPWDGKWVSGHMTGAAIDIRIIDVNGRRISMRSKRLSYQENALPQPEGLPVMQKKNRKLLRDVMSAQGFSNMPIEFWHWSYGDSHWVKREKKRKLMYVIAVDHYGFYVGRHCPCGSERKFVSCHGCI